MNLIEEISARLKINPEEIDLGTNKTLTQYLISKGIATEEFILKALSEILGIEYISNLSKVTVPALFLDNIPVQYARRYNVIGVGEGNNTLKIAVCDPFLHDVIADIERFTKLPVEISLAPKEEILNLINVAYQPKTSIVEETVEELSESDILKAMKVVENTEDLLESASKAPIIKLVNMTIFHALKLRASDIHIQPYVSKVQIRYRIDGVLYDIMSLPKTLQDPVISRVKVLGQMDIAERRLPQDGRTSVRIGQKEIDIRISSVPTNYGERIVMRLLDKSARLYLLNDLGMENDHLEIMKKLVKTPNGIIFVTGPTGSGKTTTLYAALSTVDAVQKNIITIEDPIEYNLPGISQIEVSDKKGLTFANGLRSILRQDPNIIMVGEVRDVETASIAIQAALTGHLVFSTLHTNDAAGAITRLLDLGVEPYLVASSIVAAIAQRLVRIICKNCKEPYKPSTTELASISLKEDDLEGKPLYRGVGCSNCFGTGYKDRTAIYEILFLDDQIRSLIMSRRTASEIKQYALSNGFITLRMDGARKVLKGITTIDEVLRVTQVDII